MSALLLDSEIVHYEVLGRGRPIIFLHGWVGSWRYWIPTMQTASASYRAYAVDLWGFGDTAKFVNGYSLNQQVGLVERFLDQMGINRFVLVGHGLGAVIAMSFAALHADIVDRVMAVGYPLRFDLANSRLRTTTPAGLAEWLLKRSPTTDPVLADAPKTDVKAVLASLYDIQKIDLMQLWKDMTVASLLVHGAKDLLIEEPRFEDVENAPPQGHIVTFEQSGHFPMLEETSKFSRLLMDFMALNSGESVRQLQLKEEWKRRVR